MTAIGSVKLKFCRGLLAGFLMEQCRIHSTDTKYVPLNHIGVAMVTPFQCALSWIQFPVESNLIPYKFAFVASVLRPQLKKYKQSQVGSESGYCI